MSMMVSFLLSFFPRGVLDEILNLIESVSGGFPSYSLVLFVKSKFLTCQISILNCFNPVKSWRVGRKTPF